MSTVAPQEFALLAELHRAGRRTVTLPDDRPLVERHSAQPLKLLHRMSRKGLLRQVGRGRYLVVGPGGREARQEAEPFALLDAALAPRRYAISFLSALSHYGLTDHESEELTILIDSPRGKSAPTAIAKMAVRAVVVRRDDRWFGIRIDQDIGGRYRIADPERALIDSLDRPELAGGPEVVVRALARGLRNDTLRLARLLGYAEQHSGRLARRVGFLLQITELATDEQLAGLLIRARATRKYDSLFGIASDGKPGQTDTGWRLHLDVPAALVCGWAMYEKAA
jgi:predicted transcriptional regulator of viral defense system